MTGNFGDYFDRKQVKVRGTQRDRDNAEVLGDDNDSCIVPALFLRRNPIGYVSAVKTIVCYFSSLAPSIVLNCSAPFFAMGAKKRLRSGSN